MKASQSTVMVKLLIVIRIYKLQPQSIQKNTFIATMYNPNSEYDNAAFIVIPAGISDPSFGEVNNNDKITLGQDAAAANTHPFYRN